MRFARNNLFTIVAIALLGAGVTRAQESIYVRIDTNYPQAVLYADSVLVGVVSEYPVAIPAGSRVLRLSPPDPNSWSVAPVSREVDAEAGDTLSVRLHFPYYYRVESIPFGADVLIEDENRRRDIGETPLLYRSNKPLRGSLLVSKAGYTLERIPAATEVWNRHVVILNPSDDLDPRAAQVDWQPPKKHRAWIDYAALGTAVVAGALAIQYKFKADDLYAEYTETGNPSLRSKIERYDTNAGIAFGTMQVGIGIFALRLALR